MVKLVLIEEGTPNVTAVNPDDVRSVMVVEDTQVVIGLISGENDIQIPCTTEAEAIRKVSEITRALRTGFDY